MVLGLTKQLGWDSGGAERLNWMASPPTKFVKTGLMTKAFTTQK